MKKSILVIFLIGILFLSIQCGEEIPKETVMLYAPATPSSIPVIIASQNMENMSLKIFTNHPQAHALFLEGDIDILVTGLSVGIKFFNRGESIKAVNSYVSGLTYLLTRDKKVDSFAELKGEEIYIPFEGSPIDEITKYFVEEDGLKYGEDIKVVYSQPTATKTLVVKGKAKNAPLPEPLVTALSAKPEVNISFGFKEYWEKLTGKTKGYPQVASFVNKKFANDYKKYINKFNEEIEKAIKLCKEEPDKAVAIASEYFEFPPKILKSALKRTSFDLQLSEEFQKEVFDYYKIIGKSLDEKYKDLFYID